MSIYFFLETLQILVKQLEVSLWVTIRTTHDRCPNWGQKKKSVRNHLFILNSIISDVLSSIKKNPIDLNIMDFRQMEWSGIIVINFVWCVQILKKIFNISYPDKNMEIFWKLIGNFYLKFTLTINSKLPKKFKEGTLLEKNKLPKAGPPSSVDPLLQLPVELL